ncbi:MAG: tripartite tricarboxylate transporter TctB family protein [Hyphomicrobiaceae bacterium]
MNVRNLIAGLVLAVVAGVYAFLIDGIPDRTLPNTPGPSFMPWLIACALGILSLALVAQGVIGLLGTSAGVQGQTDISVDSKAVLLLALLAIYVVAIPYAGFLYASVVFFVGAMVLFGARNPVVIIVSSIAIPLCLQYLFRHLFSIVLPSGSF